MYNFSQYLQILGGIKNFVDRLPYSYINHLIYYYNIGNNIINISAWPFEINSQQNIASCK